MQNACRSKFPPSRPGKTRRVTASQLLPILGLASAVGLYCGVEQKPLAPLPPTASRAQALTTTLTDCNSSSLVAAISAANAAGAGAHLINLKGGCNYSLTSVDNVLYGPNALPA